jgi:N-acetylmuramic acid 6-phosphate (MurNAc-6-P) etherase
VEIADSARKHGVADEDIRHAVQHALRAVMHGDRILYIGPDRSARLLEVVVLDEEDVAIPAMQLRPKFYDYL